MRTVSALRLGERREEEAKPQQRCSTGGPRQGGTLSSRGGRSDASHLRAHASLGSRLVEQPHHSRPRLRLAHHHLEVPARLPCVRPLLLKLRLERGDACARGMLKCRLVLLRSGRPCARAREAGRNGAAERRPCDDPEGGREEQRGRSSEAAGQRGRGACGLRFRPFTAGRRHSRRSHQP